MSAVSDRKIDELVRIARGFLNHDAGDGEDEDQPQDQWEIDTLTQKFKDALRKPQF